MSNKVFELKIVEEIESLERYIGIYFNPRDGLAMRDGNSKKELLFKIKALESKVNRITTREIQERCKTIISRGNLNLRPETFK